MLTLEIVIIIVLSVLLIGSLLLTFLPNRKVKKRLAQIGSCVTTSYLLYVNNENPMSFETQNQCFAYLKQFREENVIFKLQIYRIETYSL